MTIMKSTQLQCSSSLSVTLSICCLGKACKKGGSHDIARFLTDVSAMTTGMHVESVGCLGECGRGPNILVRTETGPTQLIHHIATPSSALELLRGLSLLDLSGVDVRAMGLRLQGNDQALRNELDEALNLYSQALALQPTVGRHLILCNRSAVYLQKGMKQEALADALAALEIDGKHLKSWVRAIDAFYSLDRFSNAAELFKKASKVEGFKSATEYKSIRAALEAKGQRL